MARVTLLCLLLVTSLHHVTPFSLHRRHTRSTDLADALRMLERQRRRITDEGSVLGSSQRLRRLPLADFSPWFNDGTRPESTDEMSAAWLAKTLGLDGGSAAQMRLAEEPPQPPERYVEEGEVPIPVQEMEVEPSEEELDAIFSNTPEVSVSAHDLKKKDKEVMNTPTGDAVAARVQTRSSSSANDDDVIVVEPSEGSSEKDIRLTRDEFKALLKAVDKLQKQALDKVQVVEEEVEEEGKKEEEEDEDAVENVREQVQESVDQALKEVEEKEEKEEKEEEEEAERTLTPRPQPVGNDELDNLFEETSEEVIPTDDGEIIKLEKTIKDAQGHAVGQEQSVQHVENVPGKASLNSVQDFWYLNNYLDDDDGPRKKRNSKRNFLPSVESDSLSPLPLITAPDPADLLEVYINKINQLQTELDQAKLVAYLEDLENDILTDALNAATIAQVKGHINPTELDSLQDAIKVEEALQQVKSDRAQASSLSKDLAKEIAAEFGESSPDEEEEEEEEEEEAEKRSEPWRKRDNLLQSEVPVFLTGDEDEDDVTREEEAEEERKDEESTALALSNWFDRSQQKIDLDDIFDNPPRGVGFRRDRVNPVQDSSIEVASLFSNNADMCPAVREFSTNCQFAGDSIDYEARALCNIHEMCYACGQTVEVDQGQCDFIYRAASSMLCQEDEACVLEAEVFLNTMKLKHRYVPYPQPLCRSQCAAQFLSII